MNSARSMLSSEPVSLINSNINMYLNGNAGDWGRIYFILKLISDRKCFWGNVSRKVNDRLEPSKPVCLINAPALCIYLPR